MQQCGHAYTVRIERANRSWLCTWTAEIVHVFRLNWALVPHRLNIDIGIRHSGYTQDLSCGKMCLAHIQAQKEMTLDASLKKLLKSRTKPLLFLCLRKTNGCTLVRSQGAAPAWEMIFPLHGELSTLSFGESPKDAVESTLSQILEDTVQDKYYLSQRACLGILRRAENRGKDLPPMLKQALIRQSALNPEQ